MDQENNQQPLTRAELEELLSEQTITILSAVDERISTQDRKIEEMETRINQKIEHLVTTLDVFLKRMTDMEDEFTIMKNDINKLKQVLKEKLDVDLT